MKSYGFVLPVVLALGCSTAWAQNVKVTPLGSHTGELCDRDRATIFEDPTGVRILYDAGHSVTGADDPRLGSVHVVLLSHAHGDHMGDRRLKAQDAGTCAAPETVSAAPHSTTAEIAAAKNAAIVMMPPMAAFIGTKVENIRAKPTGACAETGGALVVPLPAACLAGVHIGGARMVKTAGAARAVEITTVAAAHESTVSRALLTDPEKKNLEADNVSITLGPSSGYVIQFTNGLKVYLSGDTGLHADMKTIVSEFHKANLAVLNLGPSAVTGFSAAYAVNELLKPATVIASHVNEGATAGGKVRADSRTAAFMNLVKGRPVYLALSGKTMEFDGDAKCVAGC
jgi:L-ascorbate metabolism protein UlaG (beta-lactamase superfamily)